MKNFSRLALSFSMPILLSACLQSGNSAAKKGVERGPQQSLSADETPVGVDARRTGTKEDRAYALENRKEDRLLIEANNRSKQADNKQLLEEEVAASKLPIEEEITRRTLGKAKIDGDSQVKRAEAAKPSDMPEYVNAGVKLLTENSKASAMREANELEANNQAIQQAFQRDLATSQAANAAGQLSNARLKIILDSMKEANRSPYALLDDVEKDARELLADAQNVVGYEDQKGNFSTSHPDISEAARVESRNVVRGLSPTDDGGLLRDIALTKRALRANEDVDNTVLESLSDRLERLRRRNTAAKNNEIYAEPESDGRQTAQRPTTPATPGGTPPAGQQGTDARASAADEIPCFTGGERAAGNGCNLHNPEVEAELVSLLDGTSDVALSINGDPANRATDEQNIETYFKNLGARLDAFQVSAANGDPDPKFEMMKFAVKEAWKLREEATINMLKSGAGTSMVIQTAKTPITRIPDDILESMRAQASPPASRAGSYGPPVPTGMSWLSETLDGVPQIGAEAPTVIAGLGGDQSYEFNRPTNGTVIKDPNNLLCDGTRDC